MKTRSLSLLAVVGGVIFCTLAPISGQNAPVEPPSPQIEALIEALTAQNQQLTANQAALDEKIDALAETTSFATAGTVAASGSQASVCRLTEPL